MLSEADALRFAKNKAQIAVLQEENETILREAAVRDYPVGKHSVGKVDVVVSPVKRFDSEAAMRKYPLGPNGENIELYDATISSAKAKRILTGEEYESLQKSYNNSVTVKVNA